MPTSAPEFTVVALWCPSAEEVRFFTLPGFNFGLVAAVYAFNSITDLLSSVARLVVGVPTLSYFDDYWTIGGVGDARRQDGQVKQCDDCNLRPILSDR